MPRWRTNRTAALTTKQRGYGNDHVQERKRRAARHHPSDLCCRCHHQLGPMGPWLHLDHNADRTGYLGFSHGRPCPVCGRKCNELAAAQAGAAKTNGRATSRDEKMLRW